MNPLRRLFPPPWSRRSISSEIASPPSPRTCDGPSSFSDLSGAGDYRPSTELQPDPLRMQRLINELITRLDRVEMALSQPDKRKRFIPWRDL